MSRICTRAENAPVMNKPRAYRSVWDAIEDDNEDPCNEFKKWRHFRDPESRRLIAISDELKLTVEGSDDGDLAELHGIIIEAMDGVSDELRGHRVRQVLLPEDFSEEDIKHLENTRAPKKDPKK
jgi:hypothetical protein